MDYGKLNIHVVSDNSGFPIPDATVQITSENEPENIIEEAVTNNVGQLNNIELAAPPVDYSMTPSANKPYSEYTITISASGFESVEINGAEIFSGETAIQNASLLPLATGETDSAELFVIPDHTLWGDYPPKIPESEIKTVEETGEIVLSRVVPHQTPVPKITMSNTATTSKMLQVVKFIPPGRKQPSAPISLQSSHLP